LQPSKGTTIYIEWEILMIWTILAISAIGTILLTSFIMFSLMSTASRIDEFF